MVGEHCRSWWFGVEHESADSLVEYVIVGLVFLKTQKYPTVFWIGTFRQGRDVHEREFVSVRAVKRKYGWGFVFDN